MAVFAKETWPTRQKVFPLPFVGAQSASNSPSALSRQALRFVRGLGKAQSVLFFKNPYGSRDPLPLMANVTFFHFLNPTVSDCWRSTPCGQHMAISNTVMRQVKRLILRQGLTDF